MGPRNRPGGIQVTIELRSGAVERFEISDEIYRHLAGLISDGFDGAELCRKWLPRPMIGDPPMHVTVVGTLRRAFRLAVKGDVDRRLIGQRCSTRSDELAVAASRRIDGAAQALRLTRGRGGHCQGTERSQAAERHSLAGDAVVEPPRRAVAPYTRARVVALLMACASDRRERRPPELSLA
jgi:hypothetical protein